MKASKPDIGYTLILLAINSLLSFVGYLTVSNVLRMLLN